MSDKIEAETAYKLYKLYAPEYLGYASLVDQNLFYKSNLELLNIQEQDTILDISSERGDIIHLLPASCSYYGLEKNSDIVNTAYLKNTELIAKILNLDFVDYPIITNYHHILALKYFHSLCNTSSDFESEYNLKTIKYTLDKIYYAVTEDFIFTLPKDYQYLLHIINYCLEKFKDLRVVYSSSNLVTIKISKNTKTW
jgi:hypothetical protein